MGLSLQATHTETLISAALSLNGEVGLVSGPVPSLLRDSVFSETRVYLLASTVLHLSESRLSVEMPIFS